MPLLIGTESRNRDSTDCALFVIIGKRFAPTIVIHLQIPKDTRIRDTGYSFILSQLRMFVYRWEPWQTFHRVVIDPTLLLKERHEERIESISPV